MQEQVIKVFHKEDGKLVHVANVTNRQVKGAASPWTIPEGLEYAYFRTQNIQGSWSKGPKIGVMGQSFRRELMENGDYSPDIEVLAPLPVVQGTVYGHRSSMVGDIFEIEGQRFEARSSGFKPVQAEAA